VASPCGKQQCLCKLPCALEAHILGGGGSEGSHADPHASKLLLQKPGLPSC